MPDVYGSQGSNAYGSDKGAGSKPQPFTSSAPSGGGETKASPKGPISAGNDGSTKPGLGG